MLAFVIASVTGSSPDSTDSTNRQRLLAIASSCSERSSHFGIGRGRSFRRGSSGLPARGVGAVFMAILLAKWDGALLGSDPDLQARAHRADGQVMLTEATHQVERRPRRLLPGEPERIGIDARLD